MFLRNILDMLSDPSVHTVHCAFTVAMIMALEIFSHPE